jgi:GT2 family glycosyltransferase
MNTRITIAALLTCHNRRAKTLNCLEALFAQDLPEGARVSAFLADDGSTDGTIAAVEQAFPQVSTTRGDGSLFWARGMCLAYGIARTSNPDFFLLLNDDTTLFPNAVRGLLDTCGQVSAAGPAIVVASAADPLTGQFTYGGVRRADALRRMRFVPLAPGAAPLPCETFNGNCVLIPRAIIDQIGFLDAVFTHAMADIDYGLRAAKHGFSSWIAPGFLAQCARNDPKSTWSDVNQPLRSRLRKMRSPKGLPPADWAVLCRRHAGAAWPLYWASPFAGVIAGSLLQRVLHRRVRT